MKAQSLEIIAKRYKDQWLLIRIIDFDEKRTLPLTGRLLARSKDRDEVYLEERLTHKKHKWPTFVVYSGEPLEKGYAALF